MSGESINSELPWLSCSVVILRLMKQEKVPISDKLVFWRSWLCADVLSLPNMPASGKANRLCLWSEWYQLHQDSQFPSHSSFKWRWHGEKFEHICQRNGILCDDIRTRRLWLAGFDRWIGPRDLSERGCWYFTRNRWSFDQEKGLSLFKEVYIHHFDLLSTIQTVFCIFCDVKPGIFRFPNFQSSNAHLHLQAFSSVVNHTFATTFSCQVRSILASAPNG